MAQIKYCPYCHLTYRTEDLSVICFTDKKSQRHREGYPKFLAEASWTILYFIAHSNGCIPTNVFMGLLVEKQQKRNLYSPKESLKLAQVFQIWKVS